MFVLPKSFTDGEPLRWRRVPGLVLAEVQYGSDQRLHRESHARARFVLIVRGGLVQADGTVLGASTLMYLPAASPRGLAVAASGATCLVLEMDEAWLARARQQGRLLSEAAVFRGGLPLHLALRLHSEFQKRDEMSRLAIESLALGVLAETSRRAARAAGGRQPVPAWLVRARVFVDRHFAERLLLATVAAVVGVHPVHLARSFRRSFDTTFATYVRDVRLEHARRQLLSSPSPLGEIAASSGFYDQSHFCRCFKRATGLSPAEYRLAFRFG